MKLFIPLFAALLFLGNQTEAQTLQFTSTGTVEVVDGETCNFSANVTAYYHLEKDIKVIDELLADVTYECLPDITHATGRVQQEIDGQVIAIDFQHCEGDDDGIACAKVVNVGTTIVDDLNGLIR